MKITGMQRMALKEAVGSNSGPNYPGIIKVDAFRGVHTMTVSRFSAEENGYIDEVVDRVDAKGNVTETTIEFPKALDAIVEHWGE